jgi:hypothetical protein
VSRPFPEQPSKFDGIIDGCDGKADGQLMGDIIIPNWELSDV